MGRAPMRSALLRTGSVGAFALVLTPQHEDLQGWYLDSGVTAQRIRWFRERCLSRFGGWCRRLTTCISAGGACGGSRAPPAVQYTARLPPRGRPRQLQMRVRPASVREIFEARPLPGSQGRPRGRHAGKELGVVLQPVVQPVILGLKPDQDASRPAVTGNEDLLFRRHPEVAREVILDLRQGHFPGPAGRARRATLRLGPSR